MQRCRGRAQQCAYAPCLVLTDPVPHDDDFPSQPGGLAAGRGTTLQPVVNFRECIVPK
jgi:hypothetical protein